MSRSKLLLIYIYIYIVVTLSVDLWLLSFWKILSHYIIYILCFLQPLIRYLCSPCLLIAFIVSIFLYLCVHSGSLFMSVFQFTDSFQLCLICCLIYWDINFNSDPSFPLFLKVLFVSFQYPHHFYSSLTAWSLYLFVYLFFWLPFCFVTFKILTFPPTFYMYLFYILHLRSPISKELKVLLQTQIMVACFFVLGIF